MEELTMIPAVAPPGEITSSRLHIPGEQAA